MVFGFFVGDFVDMELFIGCMEEIREVVFDIFNIVEFGGEWVVDVDDNDFLVGFIFIEESYDIKNFDLFDLIGVVDKFINFVDVEWVVVIFGFGFGVNGIGVFLGLELKFS